MHKTGPVRGGLTALTAYTADTYCLTGQLGFGANTVYETFLGFDTSSVVGTVSSAVLSMYVTAKSTGGADFTMTAAIYDWGATLTTADWVPGASLSGLTKVATVATTGVSDAAYNTFTNVAFPANVNKSGTTRIVLYSDRTEANTSPGSFEYVEMSTADVSGTTEDPKLVVVAAALSTPVFMHHLRQQGMA